MRKIELLAPAGDYKSFVGAINAGADAVYISGKQFGARKFANNFTKEEIRDLVMYAHKRNVLVFVTINTLIFEEELPPLFLYADYLVESKVDALIVQDLGVIEAFVKRYPKTEIHASTQMNTVNIEQLKYLKSIGVTRAILAREVSVDTIKKMKQEVDIDIETFVHGALCVSYSGNCLLSYKQGGRSGNRGECAQPCRLKYSLYRDQHKVTDDAYLLSTKDLMTLDKLKDIIYSGALSLKIEGRMKKPEYVVATIRAYREAIDHILTQQPFDIEKRLEELKSVFNREYTKGYILNEFRSYINNSHRPNHQGIMVGEVISYNKGKTKIKVTNDLNLHDGIRIISKNDIGGKVDRILKNGEKVTSAKNGDIVTIDLMKQVYPGDKVMKTQDIFLEDSLKDYLSETYKTTELTGELNVFVNKPVSIHMKTPFSNNIHIESNYIVEEARNPKQTEKVLYEQFNKFGNTHYFLNDVVVNTDQIGFIPNKVINDLRRDVITKLEEDILNRYDSVIENITPTLKKKPKVTNKLIVKVETKEQLEAAEELGIKTIYYAENINPKIVTDSMYKLQNRIWNDQTKYNGNTVIRDFGGLHIKNDNTDADTTMNVTNHLSLMTLFNNGIKMVSLSIENTDKNLKQMIDSFQESFHCLPNVSTVLYGKTEVMLSKYCPITTHDGSGKLNCNLCENNNYYLADESGGFYRLVRDGDCNIKILNKQADSLFRKVDEFYKLKITNFRLNFTNESKKETKEIILKFKQKLSKIA